MDLVISGNAALDNLKPFIALTRSSGVRSTSKKALRLADCDYSVEVRRQVKSMAAGLQLDQAYLEPRFNVSCLKLLVMDMDSTLITIECIDELADFAGRKAEVAAITEATMRGEIVDFSESLRRRVALLAGLDQNVLERVFSERLQLTRGALDLIAMAKANGLKTLLVSGGFSYFADRLRQDLSLSEAYANELEISEGKLTGRVVGRIIDSKAKAVLTQAAMRDTNCGADETMAIGDGANDIPMLESVVHSVAFHAKPATAAIARYAVEHGDLSVVVDYLE